MTLSSVVQIGSKTSIVIAIGGTVYYFTKDALRRSSKGCRLAGGAKEVIINRPRIRRWAAWFGVVTSVYSARMVTVRPDLHFPVNFALAWGGANALFSAHRGTRAAAREGLKGVAYSQVAALAAVGLILVLKPPESSTQ